MLDRRFVRSREPLSLSSSSSNVVYAEKITKKKKILTLFCWVHTQFLGVPIIHVLHLVHTVDRLDLSEGAIEM